ncbi:TetR/AcrR family transcriptional regulator C-terminal domain-containing protein [Streptomyces mobaraensis NBRC 13819 = DSM 40847]|uniref:TetR family transcriptional regulator n=1 Tax=Streptomyces mobaraensis (strain ATCC 29032 / DSM 40847 / JCM 4168 / NBRC 13819 / NCIMB 11159 / IPCR 16-22) TaxID=1223523 RepID=M3A5V9_STRM1|nr:TetR/AcrR family transcriptional regulator [Streptomyces mobaraensis]EMF00489.1 TetR family transcriptional regulator [Streptomyces mobaraensis NBRC 13819 = DSM 40847]QTT74842.1 TetR/AcrR family transcriptional regulator C-terminal domain-containing protein [Streptomyces mobaraensis NBRC 13819 = DSM 40847]
MAGGNRAGNPRTSIWLAEGKPAPRRRASADRSREQPGSLDRERIIAAAIRLLDAEGLTKFSMRRLAAELGVTAMSVYWYVDNKDDLLELVLDEVSGEMALPDPDAEDADWRDQLRQLAHEYRGMLVRHPWVARLVGQYLNIGPRSMRFSDATLRVLRRSGAEPSRISGSLGALFQFVYGFATVQTLYEERCRDAGLDQQEYLKEVSDSLTESPDFAERYSESMAMAQRLREEPLEDLWERDFTVGLDTVIAGIEVMRDRLRDEEA